MSIVKPSRDIEDRFFDSTIWKNFPFRPDDVIIATYGKSGTTWTQQIVSQLIFSGEENVPVAKLSPWLDFRHPSKEEKLTSLESQTNRRFIKTHLPADALTMSDEAKYIYVARDGRDVAWSWFNHYKGANQLMYDLLEYNGEAFPEPIEPIEEYFRHWLENDGKPAGWPFWEHIKSWWNIRDLANVLVLHFNELKEDLPKQIERIADFLDISVDDRSWDEILEHCSFKYMKEHAEKFVPFGGLLWDGGAQTFINKGTNSRWHDILTPEDNEKYYAIALEKLGPECALWLGLGNSPENIPENINMLHTMEAFRTAVSNPIARS